MRNSLTRREQQAIASWLKSQPQSPPLTIRQIAERYSVTRSLAESIISRFEIPHRRTPTDAPLPGRIQEEWELQQIRRNRAQAKAGLRREIDHAKATSSTAPPYKKGPLQW